MNRTIADAIPLLAARSDLQLVVLTGPAHEPVVAAAANREMDLIVRTVPFLERMELALAVADLAVARAGANTIHELAACAIPSILVPYPHATDDHQAANARELERAGAAEVYLDRELTPEGLARRILSLVGEGERRAVMAKAGAAWAKPDADARVAGLVRAVARPMRGRPSTSRRPGSIPTLGVPSLGRRAGGPSDRDRRGRHAEPRPALPREGHRGLGVGPQGLGWTPRARRRGRSRSRRSRRRGDGRTRCRRDLERDRARTTRSSPLPATAASPCGRGSRRSRPSPPTVGRSPSPARPGRRRRRR